MACKKQCGGKPSKKQSGGVVRTSGGVGPTTQENERKRRGKGKQR